MALWQYTFQILTKESFESLQKDSKLSSEEHLFDDEPYWQFKLIHKSYFEGIENILKKGKSWSEKIALYGNEASDCVEIFFDIESNVVQSVSFRIDFTGNYEFILSNIIEFCILKGLIILDEKLQVVPLNYDLARSVIENAPQVSKYNALKSKR